MAKRQVIARFGNRIVRTGVVEAGSLLGNERNFRIHPQAQQAQLGVLLGEVGFVQGVIVNLRSSAEWGSDRGVETLVDGHLRAQLALSRGEETLVPVTYVDLSPAEERAVLATFDAIGALAALDAEKLVPLASEVSLDFADTDLDLSSILKMPKERVQGLTHDVTPCTCCEKRCKPGCGCYRSDE